MKIFYGESKGRQNVGAELPVDASLEEALNVFRHLDEKKGFLGIQISGPFVLQILPCKKSIRVELLDSSIPAIDSCETDLAFAEVLIKATAEGRDVFQLAKQSLAGWEHLKLGH